MLDRLLETMLKLEKFDRATCSRVLPLVNEFVEVCSTLIRVGLFERLGCWSGGVFGVEGGEMELGDLWKVVGRWRPLDTFGLLICWRPLEASSLHPSNNSTRASKPLQSTHYLTFSLFSDLRNRLEEEVRRHEARTVARQEGRSTQGNDDRRRSRPIARRAVQFPH